MSAIKAVVFDWAGTMIDFGCIAPVKALQTAFAAEDLVISEAEARKDMGRAKRDHVAAILAEPRIVAAWRERHGAPPSQSDLDRVYTALVPLMAEAAATQTDLIPGAAATADWLASRGIRFASSTGYTRAMMQPILARAAAQGYAPAFVVCAGETAEGRPSPLPMYKAMLELGVWPAWHCVKVDDAVVGVEEGRNAGAWTIGIAASGNGVGLGLAEWQALDEASQRAKSAASGRELRDAGADYVIATIADLKDVLVEIERRIGSGERPRL
jgi:phosphonoacetaldehyde hydrolase